MVAGQLHGLIGRLRFLAETSADAIADGQLLEAFCVRSDEAAFETLVRRHGPMVLGTCRRILPMPHDADDAFQATFLVLVRKAHTLGRRDLIGPWLHVVACRTARKLRANLARRHRRERPLTDLDYPVTIDREPNSDLRAVLDEALDHLPQKYREAMILCELEGHSRQEAAEALGLPQGTLSSRLARGRQLLARILERRGVALSAGALAGALAHTRAEAALSPALIHATVREAVVAKAALAPALMLTQGVLHTMTPTKLKTIVALLIGCAFLAATMFPRPGAAEQAGEASQAVVQSKGPYRATPRKHSVILLWMSGGPSQMDTFDLKPGQATGGPFKEINTNVKGIRISEYLPKLARHMDKMVLIRGMTHREGDHNRATHLMLTGYQHQQGMQYAGIGTVLARELGDLKAKVPNYVRTSQPPFTVLPGSAAFDVRYAPVILGFGDGLQVPNLASIESVDKEQAEAWSTALTEAVDLSKEKDLIRAAYGNHRFGEQCLIARRLIERRVPVVDITLGGWDTHGNNFGAVAKLSAVLDSGWSALMADLKDRKLLDTTLIVWMGEFGRTPRINQNLGRDHFPQSFTVVLAGGGIKGGQVIGKTNADGAGVAEQEVTVPELYATIYQAVGVDRKTRYPSVFKDVTIPIIDGPADPIAEVLPGKGKSKQ
jgi:RNA polymerase sigma factor (sigma-70 family)